MFFQCVSLARSCLVPYSASLLTDSRSFGPLQALRPLHWAERSIHPPPITPGFKLLRNSPAKRPQSTHNPSVYHSLDSCKKRTTKTLNSNNFRRRWQSEGTLDFWCVYLIQSHFSPRRASLLTISRSFSPPGALYPSHSSKPPSLPSSITPALKLRFQNTLAMYGATTIIS